MSSLHEDLLGRGFTRRGLLRVLALASAVVALRSAGNAVGGAVKKTWNCVSSLFSDC